MNTEQAAQSPVERIHLICVICWVKQCTCRLIVVHIRCNSRLYQQSSCCKLSTLQQPDLQNFH